MEAVAKDGTGAPTRTNMRASFTAANCRRLTLFMAAPLEGCFARARALG
jgi:hypothetical protein